MGAGGALPARREAGPVGGADGGERHKERDDPRGGVENAVTKRLGRGADECGDLARPPGLRVPSKPVGPPEAPAPGPLTPILERGVEGPWQHGRFSLQTCLSVFRW